MFEFSYVDDSVSELLGVTCRVCTPDTPVCLLPLSDCVLPTLTPGPRGQEEDGRKCVGRRLVLVSGPVLLVVVASRHVVCVSVSVDWCLYVVGSVCTLVLSHPCLGSPHTLSNLFLYEDTFPVTTGEGDRLLRVTLVPVAVLPLDPVYPPPAQTLSPFSPGVDTPRVLVLVLSAGLGLGLLVLLKGVFPLDLATGIRDSTVLCSNLSLVFVTEPWFAPANILLGMELLPWSNCLVLRDTCLVNPVTVFSISFIAVCVSCRYLSMLQSVFFVLYPVSSLGCV